MTTAAKAHGMDGTLVEPDWPPLTLPEARALLCDFDKGCEPVRILSASPRPFAAASVVSTGNGRLFVKRHHRQVRDREGLLEEHRFIAHLRANGAAVPRVIADSLGETAIERDEWTYEVHEVPQGIDLYEDAMSWTPFLFAGHAYSAGQALALLHNASRDFDASRRKARPLVASFTIFADADPQAALNRFLSMRPALQGDSRICTACDEALELLSPFHTELAPLLPLLASLWTHNDLHASNLLWTDQSEDARATSIIDFGLADRTSAVHDLAHAIERNVVEWLGLLDPSSREMPLRIHFAALDALLAGYESVRALSPVEAEALAPMMALCHAEFALSEVDYFLSVLSSREKTQYPLNYLVDHARWFRSADGARLLDVLRQWAESRCGGEAT